MHAHVCTRINTPSFIHMGVASACHKHWLMWVYTLADPCSVRVFQVLWHPLLCILLLLLQDIEFDRGRVSTCSNALHVSNSHIHVHDRISPVPGLKDSDQVFDLDGLNEP